MNRVRNYIDGKWVINSSGESTAVINPASGETISNAPAGYAEDVNKAAEAAARALPQWRNIPAVDRIQYLFKLKSLVEKDIDELARICTTENGKTVGESKAEIKRAIENIEVACGIPSLMQSDYSNDIASGVDEFILRQPVGICACISPFNFPVMIPFWFIPYALACGNTCIVKPSERVPLSMQKIFELLEQLNLPAGVVNLVNGGKTVVDSILEHPLINAVSFVGSTPVAKYIYARAASHGKRVQAQGGAKNPVVVLPDADIEMSTRIITDSVYGCAGQRCLAASNIILVGESKKTFTDKFVQAAETRVTGNGLDSEVEMGPVISVQSKSRVEALIKQGESEGAEILVDGRGAKVSGYEMGYFIKPTILNNVNPKSELFRTEIFGPVMSILTASDLDEAISIANSNSYGNAASIFTKSGFAARRFRNEVDAGNIGINIGVAAPMAFFPFSGWKDSFFGDLHGQAKHAVEFFTQTKIVIERWPSEWTRKF